MEQLTASEVIDFDDLSMRRKTYVNLLMSINVSKEEIQKRINNEDQEIEKRRAKVDKIEDGKEKQAEEEAIKEKQTEIDAIKEKQTEIDNKTKIIEDKNPKTTFC